MRPAPENELALNDVLSSPDDSTMQALTSLDGDIIVLGAGGKMGPTLARMARRALDAAGASRDGPDARRVIAVSRFSDASVATSLASDGVDIIRADLADPHAVASLPFAPNVLWLAGQKFGTTGDPVGTWTQNVVASTHAAEHFARARIVCFSTGNVYARTRVDAGGSREGDTLAPDGEYAASCVGRERVFESVARRTGSPLLLFRLFYACDLRYGVITDLVLRVLRGDTISLATPIANVIWQTDANRLALRALAATTLPATALNVSGPAISIRDVAERIGALLGVTPHFADDVGADALVANVHALHAELPFDALPLDTLIAWAIAWIRQDGRLLGKPTKFEVRDGRF